VTQLQSDTIKALRSEVKQLRKRANLAESYARLYDQVLQENRRLKLSIRNKAWLGKEGQMTLPPKPDTPQERKELGEFLKTLKVHNKDLSACFNDAVAVVHIEHLIDRLLDQARSDAIGEGCKALQAVADELEPDLYGHDWMRLVSVVNSHIEQLKKEAK